MISGVHHVDIILGFIRFSDMRVVSQVSFLNELFEKSTGQKRTWVNPMCSKQWKSRCEIDNFSFRFVYVFFRFLKQYEK